MSAPSSGKKAKETGKPLPLSETLRDLALLRTSDVDLAALLPSEYTKGEGNDKGDAAVKESSEFIAETRNAVKLHDRGSVEVQGKQLDEIRRKYEELLEGLSGSNQQGLVGSEDEMNSGRLK
ncbi:hypothetical protein FA15DRAFT_703605 [Coprinopsis marcescibilis]|uniref:Uncharacterized protein n=1 Tax=Coprinopsis marcescibilis TaxID=230819 RepID=A0A5C3KXX0_COPMA|nr:hypothetical protein FA15DRAFT_703605 [Coprinopsis marcescibilis]